MNPTEIILVNRLRSIVVARFGMEGWQSAGDARAYFADHTIGQCRAKLSEIAGVWVDQIERSADKFGGNRTERFAMVVSMLDEALTIPNSQQTKVDVNPKSRIGDIVARITKQDFDFKMCSGCDSLRKELNALSPQECREQIDRLAAKMKANSKHQPLFKLATAVPHVVAAGGPLEFCKQLLTRAIEEAEAKDAAA